MPNQQAEKKTSIDAAVRDVMYEATKSALARNRTLLQEVYDVPVLAANRADTVSGELRDRVQAFQVVLKGGDVVYRRLRNTVAALALISLVSRLVEPTAFARLEAAFDAASWRSLGTGFRASIEFITLIVQIGLAVWALWWERLRGSAKEAWNWIRQPRSGRSEQ